MDRTLNEDPKFVHILHSHEAVAVAKSALLLVVFGLRFGNQSIKYDGKCSTKKVFKPCLLGSNPIGGAFLGGSLGGGAR